MNKEGCASRIYMVSPRGIRWLVNQLVHDLSAVLTDTVEVLGEKGANNSFYDQDRVVVRENAFSIQENDFCTLEELPKNGDTVFIPLVYPYPNTSGFLDVCIALGRKGVKVITVLLESLAIDEMMMVIDASHKVLVFDSQDKFLLLKKGIVPDKISIQPMPMESFENLAQKEKNQKIITIPDTGLSKSEYEDIIQAAYAISEHDSGIRIQLVRTPQNYVSSSMESQFPKDFVEKIELRGLSGVISLIDSSICLSKFREYVNNSDVIVLSGAAQSSVLERRSIASLALQSNVPILRSVTTGIADIDALSIQMTSYRENTIGRAILEFLGSPSLVSEINAAISAYRNKINARERFLTLIDNITLPEYELETSIELIPETSSVISLQEPMPRILLKNRSNAFTHPGGDTVVMKRLLEGLESEGFDVNIDLEEKEDVSTYDLVHLFNFAIKEVTESHARDCVTKGVPYVVTTLYEDWPKFYNQMAQMYIALDAYVKHGQPSDRWIELEDAAKQATSSGAWDNTFSAVNAECLIATGDREAESLLRDYPSAKNVVSVPLGCEVSDERDGGSLFREKFGLHDFIFCVGRLEWRKNQLMLLKALEDTDDTIVFAASGFTYQPEYEALCKSFRRKGKTIFLDRLTSEELASAYQAASMHVLPSWFELPGLVSLEAGRYGTPVVVSDTGSTRSYTGNFGFYCTPDSADSIRSAVDQARAVDNRAEISAYFSQYTWNASVSKHAEIYRMILSRLPRQVSSDNGMVVFESSHSIEAENTSQVIPEADQIPDVPENAPASEVTYESLCKEGDIALSTGKKELAMESFKKAIRLDPAHPRALRSLGAVHYYSGSLDEAEPLFSQALSLDPNDVKSMLGKGAVLWDEGERDKAYILFKQASDMSPGETSVILYMVNASYELEKYKELEDSLRSYLRIHPDNISIQYCLAGCYFKQEKYSAASGVVERMLSIKPDDAQALELKSEIRKILDISDLSVPEVSIEDQDETSGSESSVYDRIIKLDEVPSLKIPEIEISDDMVVEQEVANLKPESLESRIEFVNRPDHSSGAPVLLSGREEIVHLESLKRDRKYHDILKKADTFLAEKSFEEQARIRILILKAEALGFLGKIQDAKEILKKMLSEDIMAPRVLSGMGALEASEGNWETASEYFERSLLEHPAMDVPFAGLGMCARSLGQNEDAWNYFSESAKRNPENIHAILGLLDLAYALDRLDEVEEYLREYLEHKPVDLNILYSLAGCLYAQGKTADSVSELNSILAYDPGHESARELLMKIHKPESESREALLS